MITTEKLELIRFSEANIEEYINVMTQPMVSRYLGNGVDITKEAVKNLVDQFETDWDKGYGVFAVKEKTSGQVIGHCGIRPLPDERIELLYAYDPSSWGKGYATEAGEAVLAYGKEHFGLTELIGISYPQNKGSIAVLKKLGFQYVGMEEYFGKELEVFRLKV